jgi:(R,R)-butanediol dehydrogenase / meso-butanediol dehydrogenase / diacetyl reductase
MLAAQYVASGGIVVVETEPRPPGPGEVQLAVAYVGICGTDLHILHGDMDDRVASRAVIGHEMSGRVLTCGAGVTEWSEGDPVVVLPLRWCGACPTCGSGHRHICDRLDFVGIDSPGALQEVWTVPEELLVPLPPGLSLRAAALVEPVAVAHHDVGRARLVAGERVLVIGGGPVGLLIAVIAEARGADVRVVEIDPFRRSVFVDLGIGVTDPNDGSLQDLVERWTDGAGVAVAFEVSGSQGGLDSAVSLLGARGRLVVVGIHVQPRPVDLKRVFWRELEIVGARVYEPSDFTAAVALVADGTIPVEAIVSEIVPLRMVGDAFDSLAAGGRVMKVLVDCRGGEPA